MRTRLFLLAAVVAVAAERPKLKDHSGQYLVRISDIPINSCGDDSYFGLGIMNGTLEKCSMWQEEDEDKQADYELYKCKHLRVHAEIQNGKCVCKGKNYKGAICNEFHGCPDGYSTYKGMCTKNVCQHDGELAVGAKEIECICKVPWDGRYCERLACWRKTNFGQDLRFANNGTDSCKCGKHYTGFPECDIITSCENNAELVDGKCQPCPSGFGGEICDRRCPKGEVTCFCSSLRLLLAFAMSFLIAANKF